MHECDFCSNTIDFHEIVECIASALDAKDPYTAGHSRRVSDMALVLCRLMGLKEEDTEKIHIAGHLHDIGKIGVPDAVLNKEGKLTDGEFAFIRKHPQIGADILNKSHQLRELSEIVLMHHERYDGKGYPTGAKDIEIPVGARILAKNLEAFFVFCITLLGDLTSIVITKTFSGTIKRSMVIQL